MRWSWKIGSIAGIGLYVHATFLLVLLWVGLAHFAQDRSWMAALAGVGFVSLVFGIVVLHELGHALAARRYGIRTRDITLLPIGGVARLERMPDKPRQELVVALAGPAVNVALAAVFAGFLLASDRAGELREADFVQGSLPARLAWLNAWLAAFNMIPAFPMDGGRVLRALLALRLDYATATAAAAKLGQAIALLFGFLGLLFNPFLIFIALFVWIGASEENAMVQVRWSLAGVPVFRAMITDFRTLAPSDPLSLASELVLEGFQQDFPVVQDGGIVGVLTRSRLLQSLAREGPAAPVGSAMSAEFVTVDPTEMLDAAMARLQSAACPSAPVMKDGRLVGMITLENIGEFLMIQSALHARPALRSGQGSAGPEAAAAVTSASS